MAELDEQGQLTRAYGWDPATAQSGLWSTEPLWQAELNPQSPQLKATATRYHYLHTDHLATPMVASDKTGSQTWKSINEAFGHARVDNASPVTMNLRLPGQYFDGESGEHHNYHRDYGPQSGRYLQRDPIGLNGGINPYAYVESSPLRYVDTRGLWAQVIGKCATPGGATACLGVAIAIAETIKKICQGNPDWSRDWMTSESGEGDSASDETDNSAQDDENLSREDRKSIRSLEKRIEEHKEKIERFKEKAQHERRLRHLEGEVRTFQGNIDKIRGRKR